MEDSDPGRISTAFDVILAELRAEVDAVNASGARAFASGDIERAKQVLVSADCLGSFREQVLFLRREWELLSDRVTLGIERDAGLRPWRNRLRPGERTPEEAYREPILRILEQLQGRGPARLVLEEVHRRMAAHLTPADLQATASNPRLPRWRIAAQRMRLEMIREGLLRADSPRGVWELTDAGRAWLAAQPEPPAEGAVAVCGER
ncbi:MAG: winged helix-turn-helix domain-containing protein [Armatimonadetes bacterium]|nr:winged helix-turn-helix domain-containing protein [Armatimonadota bacterium]